MEGVKTISLQPDEFSQENKAMAALLDIVRKGR
jgi:hypothetical protein